MSKISIDWKHRDATQDENNKYFEFDCGHNAPMYIVHSIHALNTLVGYCKYLYQNEGSIYYRGQTCCYKSMKPALYREVTTNKSLSRKQSKLNSLIQETSSKIRLLNNMDQKLVAPLLQHYGIKTNWLDLVDNLWVALWFSIHEYIVLESNKKYEHIKRVSREKDFVYLYLIFSDAVERHDKIPGYYKGATSEVVDLRAAAPSVFLRPHNQHAILMKKRNVNSNDMAEMAEMVKLVIKIDPNSIMEWVGLGRLLTTENIYPSPIYDQGYSILLKDCHTDLRNGIGSITSIYHEAFI